MVKSLKKMRINKRRRSKLGPLIRPISTRFDHYPWAKLVTGAKLYLNDEGELTTDNTGTPTGIVDEKGTRGEFLGEKPRKHRKFQIKHLYSYNYCTLAGHQSRRPRQRGITLTNGEAVMATYVIAHPPSLERQNQTGEKKEVRGESAF